MLSRQFRGPFSGSKVTALFCPSLFVVMKRWFGRYEMAGPNPSPMNSCAPRELAEQVKENEKQQSLEPGRQI
jgi:hypothetical protein